MKNLIRTKVIVSHCLSAGMASFGESEQLVLIDEAFKSLKKAMRLNAQGVEMLDGRPTVFVLPDACRPWAGETIPRDDHVSNPGSRYRRERR